MGSRASQVPDLQVEGGGVVIRFFADMDPTVQIMLAIGVAWCITGAAVIGMLARDEYLHRQRVKARRVKAAATTRVYRPFELSDAFRHQELRREGYPDQPWRERETVAGQISEQPTQVVRYDSTGRWVR